MTEHNESIIDPRTYRDVLGQYPTGVVVITATSSAGEPLGMTVGSFNSASLNPALVMFMPDRNSNSWRALRESGDRFGVNVLSAEQEHVCRAVATRKTDKLAGIRWQPSAHGNPVIDGCVAHLDCEIVAIHAAGDHDMVVGRVLTMSAPSGKDPLLFFRGGYGSFTSRSLAVADSDLLEQLRLIDSIRPMMDDLSAELQTEVTASCLVRNELVLAAAAGRTRTGELSQVGRRVAFRAPFGSVFAAWLPAERIADWIRAARPESAALHDRFHEIAGLVRQRGYGITLPHGDPARGWPGYNPVDYGPLDRIESITAPVFGPDAEVAFALTIWGGKTPADLPTELLVERITATAERATVAISGVRPSDA